jgi:(2Fe-2S) ferredoxin
MNSTQYRVFVCSKQRPEGGCSDCGAIDIYQTFQAEITIRQLTNRVTIQQSGCLDCCAVGAVALVYRTNRVDLTWLPTKLRLKLRRWLFPHRHTYGRLQREDIPAIVQNHFIDGKPFSPKLVKSI